MKITVPKSEAITGGKYRDEIHDMRALGCNTDYDNTSVTVCAAGKNVDIIMPFSSLDQLILDGGSFSDMEFGIKVLAANLDDEIPAGLPNREYQVVVNEELPENDPARYETRIRTWRDWRDAQHPLVMKPDDTEAIFTSNPYGFELSCDDYVLIRDSAGVSVMSIDQYSQTLAEWFPQEQLG